MNDNPFVEDLLTLNILLHDIHILDGNIIGEFARRSVEKNKNTVQILTYNNQICYVNKIDAVFKSNRCPSSDTFFNKASNLERHQTVVLYFCIEGKFLKLEKLF